MSAPYPTARAATALSGLAVISPLAGVVAEMCLAWCFGASPTVDAFRIGTLIFLLGQQVFVGHILPHVIVPVFSEYRARGEEKEAWHVALSIANILLVSVVLVSLAVFLHPDPVVRFLAPGLTGEARDTASLFIRWFLPTYVLLMWSGVATGVLYAHKVFWVAPAAQLIGNAVLTVAIVGLGRSLGAASLVLGILLAALLGAALHASKFLPLMRAAGTRYPWGFDVAHPGVRKTLRLGLPVLGMVLLVHWGAVILSRALSQLPAGSLAQFGYAWKMGTLVSLVPFSLATVLFPRFAEARFSSASGEFHDRCTQALRMALFLTLPLTCLLYALRVPVVALVLQRGAFSGEACEAVSGLFGMLLLGAPAAAASAYMEKMLYALGEMRIPMYAQLASALLLTALAQVVAVRLGVHGLMVLAGPVIGYVAATLFFLVLHARHQAFRLKEVAPFAARILVLALVSGWIGRQASALLERVSAPPLLALGLVTAGGLAAGGGVFLAASLAWQVPEALACSRYLRWQGDAVIKRVQDVVRG